MSNKKVVLKAFKDEVYPIYGLSEAYSNGTVELTQAQAKFVKKTLADFDKVQDILERSFKLKS